MLETSTVPIDPMRAALADGGDRAEAIRQVVRIFYQCPLGNEAERLGQVIGVRENQSFLGPGEAARNAGDTDTLRTALDVLRSEVTAS